MGYTHLLMNTDGILKHKPKGGFSSKKKIECSSEIGSKARTHRPSLSPTTNLQLIKTKIKYKGRQVVTW